jgi:enoyl-CoA hydratase
VSALVCSRIENHALHVLLSRPARGNALSPELVEALIDALDSAATAAAPLLVLEGSGKHFCTGIDLNDIGNANDADLLQRFVRIEHMLDRIWRAPFLTIAVARGRAIGAGADLFAACDLRLAVAGSQFAFPGAGFGIVLGTRRLAARTRPDLAMELVLSGRTVPAREAVELGLATRCLMPNEIEQTLMATYATARRCPAGTVGRVRRAAYGDERAAADDLAALTASAATRGLRERILAYREALRTNSVG